MSEFTGRAVEQVALPGLSDGRELRLIRELEELRFDNARLRKLLKLSEAESKAAHQDQPVVSAVLPVGAVRMDSSPELKVLLFQNLFRGRSDVYAIRWENARDGRSGWVPAVNGGWHGGTKMANANFLALTSTVVADHLRGQQHIGLYALTEENTCW